MQDTVVFTISRGHYGYNIKNAKYNTYNRIEVPGIVLAQAITELTDIFNNTLKLGILFEVS